MEGNRLATYATEDTTEPRWFGQARPGLLTSILMFLAAACGTGSFYLITAQLASFIHTDKLPLDYLAEIASGKECRSLAAMRDGGPLCRDSFDEPRYYEKPIYCYRTIGTVTCYNERDPYKTNAEHVR